MGVVVLERSCGVCSLSFCFWRATSDGCCGGGGRGVGWYCFLSGSEIPPNLLPLAPAAYEYS